MFLVWKLEKPIFFVFLLSLLFFIFPYLCFCVKLKQKCLASTQAIIILLILIKENVYLVHSGNIIFKYYNYSPIGTLLILIFKSFALHNAPLKHLQHTLITNPITIAQTYTNFSSQLRNTLRITNSPLVIHFLIYSMFMGYCLTRSFYNTLTGLRLALKIKYITLYCTP